MQRCPPQERRLLGVIHHHAELAVLIPKYLHSKYSLPPTDPLTLISSEQQEVGASPQKTERIERSAAVQWTETYQQWIRFVLN